MSYTPIGNIYAVDTTGDTIYEINPDTLATIDTITATAAGETISKILAISYNQVDQKFYAVFRFSGYSGKQRHLGTVDLSTGVVTVIGNLGDAFSGLTFDPNGVLYGITGNGADVPESLYSIDTSDASTTFIISLPDPNIDNQGEQIAYNFTDGLIYHWSGFGPVIIESINPSTLDIVQSPVSGYDPDQEIRGVLYLEDNTFLLLNFQDEYVIMTPSGFATNTGNTGPEFSRGFAQAYTYVATSSKKKKKKISKPVTGIKCIKYGITCSGFSKTITPKRCRVNLKCTKCTKTKCRR